MNDRIYKNGKRLSEILRQEHRLHNISNLANEDILKELEKYTPDIKEQYIEVLKELKKISEELIKDLEG